MSLRNLAPALIALVLVAACGGTASPSPSPSGQSRHYDGGRKGFAIDLAPGWRQSGAEADGVGFTSPRLQATMSVRYESAEGGLDGAAREVIGQLAGGDAGAPTSPATLAGVPARTFQATVTGKGGADVVSGVVAVQGDLAWSLALAGLRSSFGQAKSDFEQMVNSFEFTGPAPTPVATASLGEPAPDGPVLQLSHVPGPVVVYFFNVACQPCRQEMPLLQRGTAGRAERVTVLAVDTSDDEPSVRAFLRSIDVAFPVRYDGDGRLYEVYQVPGIPAAYFLDAHHVIRFMPRGPLDAAALAEGLASIGAD